jgi:hypothetical protein
MPYTFNIEGQRVRCPSMFPTPAQPTDIELQALTIRTD